MRALLLQREQKQRRQAKIKSRKYRKVLKAQKERFVRDVSVCALEVLNGGS
jgi:U3 small nucleolar RNA-associated protein 14